MDFNFFEPYVKVQEKTNYLNLLLVSITLVSVLGVGMMTALLFLNVYSLNKDITAKNAILESEEHKSLLTEYDVLNSEILQYSKEKEDLFIYKFYVDSKQMILEDTLGEISSNLTDMVFLKSFFSSSNVITINGAAVNKNAYVNFANSLRNSGKFSDVFIQQATTPDAILDLETIETNASTFAITLTLKDRVTGIDDKFVEKYLLLKESNFGDVNDKNISNENPEKVENVNEEGTNSSGETNLNSDNKN